jgi:excinuclease ABC subunit A
MSNDLILIRNASENNLQSVTLAFPKNKLIVVTGVSGSGKSSLIFDVLYREAESRYLGSFSSYARQFLGRMKRPDVEKITGLSPALAVDQKAVVPNPRSTVGTITEIYDYLRLLFARLGKPENGSPDFKIE